MSCRLCVTNIGFRVTENDLRNYFIRFGELKECSLKTDAFTGNSRGFAFITFINSLSQQKCLQATSHRINDKAVSVFADSQTTDLNNFKVPRSKKLFVSLLGIRGTKTTDIVQAFEQFGEIVDIEFDKSDESPEPQYCLVFFRNFQEVDYCLTRSHCIRGRQVYTRRATSREEVKLAEQRERELQAAKEQAKKVYGVHCPTKNVTIVQQRLFTSVPSLLSNSTSQSTRSDSNRKRKAEYAGSSTTETRQNYSPSQDSVNFNGYGYV